MNHVLEIDGVQLAFNGRNILSDIYLKCETGSVTGLLGRNGQGKSCLMKIIYGSLSCERSVRFDHKPVKESFRRPGMIMYLPQFHFIPKSLSVHRLFQDFELAYSEFTTRFPGFAARGRSAIGSLSGGERRLLELYVVIKSASRFAMLDEPFTHLNPLEIENVKALLAEEKVNKGFIITDHIYRDIIDVCDSLYVLKEGRTCLTKSVTDIERFGYARM
jgi:ABC-type multidrug transport system ATPase subunit